MGDDDGVEGLLEDGLIGTSYNRGSAGGRESESAVIGPTDSLNSASNRFAAAVVGLGFPRSSGAGMTSSTRCAAVRDSAVLCGAHYESYMVVRIAQIRERRWRRRALVA